MLNRVTLLTMAVLLMAVFNGCGDDEKVVGNTDDNGADNVAAIPSALAGTWTMQSATLGGGTVSLSKVFSWESASTGCQITIEMDGSYVYQETAAGNVVQWAEAGTFTVDGSTYTMTTEHPLLATGQWSVSGNELTLSITIQSGHELLILATR